ncbi:MAG: ABC transporter substrate-binding protein [Eubacteriales bacterium]|nr:ABC transporter substrate-binding protein [Eubacteriales bacterium]
MGLKKILALGLTTVLAVGTLTGCGKKDASDNKVKKVSIIQYVQHPALDGAREGFLAGLKEAGFTEGENLEVKYENASAEMATAGTIAETFANEGQDLILAIATPAAQAVAQKIKDTPILVTAVTDPADAGLVESNEKVGGNVSGTSDLSPVKEQIRMIKKVKPDAQKVGVVFCSAEDNSKLLAGLAEEEIKAQGMEYMEFTVQNSNDVQSVMESMAGKVDAIYAPTDNVISQSMSTVSEIAIRNKLPLIAGEEEQVKNGALCTKGINYFNLGKQTAAMAVKILNGEKKVEELPIEYQENLSIEVNEETAKAIGIENIKDLIK